MRTTLDLPEDLIIQAMKITGAKSKSQLIKDALNELILRHNRLRLLKFKGRIDLDIDIDSLRDR